MANLSPWDRMMQMRKAGRCAGCHKTNVNSMACGVRLEETFTQLMRFSIPKGQLRLCTACKLKMGHTHDLFKKLLLLKNVPLPDSSAVRFLDVKTLGVKWLCNLCNKTCIKLDQHQRTCHPNRQSAAATPQNQNGEINGSPPRRTRNRIILGERAARNNEDDNQTKQVRFAADTENKRETDDARTVEARTEEVQETKPAPITSIVEISDDEDESPPILNARIGSAHSSTLTEHTMNGTARVSEGFGAEHGKRVSQGSERRKRVSQASEACRRVSQASETSRKTSQGPNVVRDTAATSSHTSGPPEAERLQTQEVAPPILVPVAYKCEICNKEFNRLAGLNKHKSTKGSQCVLCKTVFCTKDQLMGHRRTEHGRGGPTLCKCCNKLFKTETEYRAHYTYMGGHCHGGPEGLISFDCACQGTTLLQRRQSVRPADHRVFRDPRVQVNLPAPSPPVPAESPHRRRAGDIIIKDKPLDEQIYDRETPDIKEEDSRKRRSDEGSPDESKRPRGSDDGGTPPTWAGPRPQSIFAKRRPQQSEGFNERTAALGLGNLMEHHRRQTIDQPSTSRATSAPDPASEAMLGEFHKMWRVLNQMFGAEGAAAAEPTHPPGARGQEQPTLHVGVGGQEQPTLHVGVGEQGEPSHPLGGGEGQEEPAYQ